MAEFSVGGAQDATSYNFMSTFGAVEPDKDDQLTRRFGRQRLTGLLDLFQHKKAATTIKYDHFEEDRLYPKIKAVNAGAGGAGAAVVFSLDATSRIDVPLDNDPYQGSGAATRNAVPVRVNDLIMIKPASGTASFGSYIQAIVTDVDETAGAAGEFTAKPTDSADAIPNVPAADEIIIFGNAHGEGSIQPKSLSTTTTEYSNFIQISKDTREVTGTEACVKNWYKNRDGSFYWMLEGETETYDRFLDGRELTIMFNEGLASDSVADDFAGTNTPLVMTQGLVPTILDRGNTFNYNGINGLTLGDLEDIVLVLDKQKGSTENTMLNGINLNGQMDRELGDRFVNGGISYGMFKMDQDKHVSLGFKTVEINGYTFHKKVLPAMNDLQSTGADGYGFPYEGLILPADDVVDKNEGIRVPSLRLRYLQKRGNQSQEMRVEYVDNLKTGDEGKDTEEVRYISYCGIEVFAPNRAFYIKRA